MPEKAAGLSFRGCGLQSVRLSITGEDGKSALEIPSFAAQMLVRILDEMSRGNTVAVTPVHPEVTTQEAADLLNISRPSLIQLLHEGKIAYRRVGRIWMR